MMKLRVQFATTIVIATLAGNAALAQSTAPAPPSAATPPAASSNAATQPPAATRATVLANHGDVKVTLADYEASLLSIPERDRLGFAQSQERVSRQVDGLLKMRTFAEEAKRLGLDSDPNVAVRVKLFHDRLLTEMLAAKLAEDAEKEFEQRRASFLERAREQYLVNKNDFRSPKEVKASHILVDTKTRSNEQALARIRELRAQILAGKSFEEVAEASSDDPTVKKNRGALGFFGTGRMDPAFEKAAFALTKPMEVSEPVRTQFGYHLIRLEEIKPEKQATFEEAAPALMDKLKAQHVEIRRGQMFAQMYDSAKVAWNEPAVLALKKSVDPHFYQVQPK